MRRCSLRLALALRRECRASDMRVGQVLHRAASDALFGADADFGDPFYLRDDDLLDWLRLKAAERRDARIEVALSNPGGGWPA